MLPGRAVVEIPHLFAPPALPSNAEVLRYRQSLGLEQGAVVFAVLGYLRESKRLMAVLEAFDALHRDFPATALLVAGEFVSSDLGARGGSPAGRARRAAAALPSRAGILAGGADDRCLYQSPLSGRG